MNPRLNRLRKLLAEAELDKNNNALYIDDLKLSIQFEETRKVSVYEAVNGFAEDD